MWLRSRVAVAVVEASIYGSDLTPGLGRRRCGSKKKKEIWFLRATPCFSDPLPAPRLLATQAQPRLQAHPARGSEGSEQCPVWTWAEVRPRARRVHERPAATPLFTHARSLCSHRNLMGLSPPSLQGGPQSDLQNEGHMAGTGQAGLDTSSAWRRLQIGGGL